MNICTCTFVNLNEKWNFGVFFSWLLEQFCCFTRLNRRVSFSPQLCQQWVLLTLDICHSDRVRNTACSFDSKFCRYVILFSLLHKLIPAGALLEGDRRRRRSLRSSEMLWPMRKPGSWQRSGKWRWRTARLPKSWRSAFMRNSRWAPVHGAFACGQLF